MLLKREQNLGKVQRDCITNSLQGPLRTARLGGLTSWWGAPPPLPEDGNPPISLRDI